jgi:hypothetical protein
LPGHVQGSVLYAGFIFLRRILEPVVQVRKHFSQELLHKRKHGILTLNRSMCNGNFMDFPLQSMLNTIVGHKVMAMVFWDFEGSLHLEYLPHKATYICSD